MISEPVIEWGPATKLIHWCTAILIFVNIAVGIYLGRILLFSDTAHHGRWLFMMNQHKTIGLIVFLFVPLRAAWTFARPRPGLPRGMNKLHRIAAKISVASLYLAMICVPLMGLLLSCFAHAEFKLFGIFDLISPVARNPTLVATFRTLHQVSAYGLLVLAATHVCAALTHHFILRDEVLRRMAFGGQKRPSSVEIQRPGHRMTAIVAPKSSGVLAGLRVLELGQVLAAPYAGSIFADLGADVLKIERIDGGDDGRRMGVAFHDGDSLIFQVFNRGKRSAAIDLKTQAGLNTVDELAQTADVLVHNLRPGVMDALGLGSTAMCARHPKLVYCEMSAFGHMGPDRLRPGYEPLIQAFSGLSSINGGPDDPPMRIGVSLCDQGAGLWAVIGALALLQRRQTTGAGGVVNVSLLETALAWAAPKVDALMNQNLAPQRHRSGHPDFAPYEAFEASDGPLLICVGNDRLFVKLSAAVGRPQWPVDPRYKDNRARLAHRTELNAEINAILRQAPRSDWLDALQAASVPCAPINDLAEAVGQPQVRALDMIQHVPGVDFTLTGPPLSFDGERPVIASAAPRLGETDGAAWLS